VCAQGLALMPVGRPSAALPLLDNAHGHRLRRDAWHLPAQRSRQSGPAIS